MVLYVPEIYVFGLEFWYLGVCVCVFYVLGWFFCLTFVFCVCVSELFSCVWGWVSVFFFSVLCLGVSGLGFCA